MTRFVEHREQGPLPIAKKDLPPGEVVYLCRCGLSRNGVYCDGSHTATRSERPEALYRYPDGSDRTSRALIRIQELSHEATASPAPTSNPSPRASAPS